MSMFQGCKGLESLDLTSFNFFNGEIFENMFDNCNNLTIYLDKSAQNVEKFIKIIPDDVNINYKIIE